MRRRLEDEMIEGRGIEERIDEDWLILAGN
jgi:hypothetical protein